ncbi:hypothetical protein TNCV_4347551 [Trichonephila clavipes]|nr:hypothetical protein TNCV_4347551 [Trichonephila clavipes]
MSLDSRIGVFCKTTSEQFEDLFAAALTLSSETMAEATLDAASQTGTSSMVSLMMNLGEGMVRCHFFRCPGFVFTASRWSHHGEPTLKAWIRHRHTGQSPGVMVWGAVGHTYQSPLVRIYGPLNSLRYTSGVLQAVALTFIRAPAEPYVSAGKCTTACCRY